MKHAILVWGLACAGALGTAGAAAQTPGAAPTAAAPAGAAPAALEPLAIEALRKMGRHLQSLQSFSLKAQTATDQVLLSGQKVQLDAALTLWAHRPDRLRVDLESDRRARQFYYDGKTVTVYGQASGYYARFAAPPTLDQLFGRVSEEFGLDLPLADLFAWGDPSAKPDQLTSALAIGAATVRGIPCEQYAFRQDGLDWQLWIQRGAQPLPRRLVLTTTDDPARPQYSVDLDWVPGDTPPDAVFTFVPPPGAHAIQAVRAAASGR